ncbi:hypothetical protein QJS66_06490 [Kocuria rhizophila]|nr:hypothetical protein QJS66_06490 [Kocuria rhizophila]
MAGGAQKNLGGDSLQRWLAQTLTAELPRGACGHGRGFRIIAVHRDSRASAAPPRTTPTPHDAARPRLRATGA